MKPGSLVALASLLPDRATATDAATLELYARDQGPVVKDVIPLAVVWAESTDHVQQLLRWAQSNQISVVPRGAGTGVSGGAHATDRCVVLSLERMNRILEVRALDEVAVVEPGVINAELNAAVAVHGLMYAPDRQATGSPRSAVTSPPTRAVSGVPSTV